ncbi:ChaN family lipoprotein [Pseudanabaena sp. FACHB-2040]|nr:ChaN family lipoprotein [Pseudanabaena sp. FACHB-2040]
MLGCLCLWIINLAQVQPAAGLASASTQPGQASLSQPSILEALARAEVVYLGETHSSPADHAAQLEIIQALVQEKVRVAIALEMFQRPYQPILDAYLASEIDEAALVEKTEYEQRWGFPWEYYAPILRFAKAQQMPVLALNTPTEITRKVAQAGLDSLSEEDFRYIPPVTEIHTDNAAYRAYIEDIFTQAHAGHGSALSFDNFFAAQVLWDETMAEGIADFRQAHPDYSVVVLAGQGHVIYGYGIPDRVARRLGDDLQQAIVILNPDAALQAEFENGVADYFWFTEDSALTSPSF